MNYWAEIIFALSFVIGGVTIVLHICFAIAVYVDAERMVHDDHLEVAFVPGPLWAIATLFGGVLVAVGYWIVNRSKIANQKVITRDFEITDYLS